MTTGVRGYVLTTMLAALAACDMPAEPGAGPQFVEWDGTTLTAPVGETFNLEQAIGGRQVSYVTGGQPVAEVAYIEGDWLVSCTAAGTSEFEITFSDNTGEMQRVVCLEAEFIDGFYTFWLNLNRRLGVTPLGAGLRGNAQALEVRQRNGALEVRCTAPGTYRYLMVALPGEPTPRWFVFNCRMGMPLPVPGPRVGIPVNVSAPFRANGRMVVGLQFWPEDVATQVVMDAALRAPSPAASAHEPAVLLDVGDVGLLCLRTGQGTVTVQFDSGAASEEYVFTCQPGHDQGGGG